MSSVAVPTSVETTPRGASREPNSAPPRLGTPSTSLYVERDRAYVLVRRRLVGTMTRAEWDTPAHRAAGIAAAWTAGIAAIRVDGLEFVAHAPIILYRHPLTGVVACADIALPGAARHLIRPEGERLTRLPHAPRGFGWTRERTTYATWAEGPLPHRVYDMDAAPTPHDDRVVQALRHQNAALRRLIDGALGPAEFADTARSMPTTDDLVDFRLRGVFRRPDFRVLVSKQDAERGSKIVTSDGIVE